MNLRTSILTLALAGLTSACTTYQPIPKDYSGPQSVITDTGVAESDSKAQIFALIEIDGNSIPNAFSVSEKASQGRGMNLTMLLPDRAVTSGPHKFLIRGSHATAAPIHAIASKMAGTFYSVEGIVDFTPAPYARYVVKGTLSKERSSVWIEDEATGKPASQVLTK